MMASAASAGEDQYECFQQPLTENHQRAGSGAARTDGADAQSLHGEPGYAHHEPEKADHDDDADGPVIIKTGKQGQTEVAGDDAVGQGAECHEQRTGKLPIGLKVRTFLEFQPETARNRQQQNDYPADSRTLTGTAARRASHCHAGIPRKALRTRL